MKIDNITVEDFIKIANVNRDSKYENCEYEVTKEAMQSYLKYPMYEDSSIEKVYDGNNRGKYCIKYNEITLTADVLTSIKIPTECASERNLGEIPVFEDTKGEDIRASLLYKKGDGLCLWWRSCQGQKFKMKIPDSLKKPIKSFAFVYYWIGNMMPLPVNYKAGSKNDCWQIKLEDIKLFFEGPEEKIKGRLEKKEESGMIKKVKDWIDDLKNEEKCNWKIFRNDNYLEDFGRILENDKNELKILSDIDKKEKNDEEKVKDLKIWFVVNTKLIIQRSYRIVTKFDGEWSDKSNSEHIINIKSIFKKVFEEAGFTEEKEIKELNLYEIV